MANKHVNLVFGLVMLACAGALWLETLRPQYEGIAALNNGFPPSFYPRILLGIWAAVAVLVIAKSFSATGLAMRPRVGRLIGAILVTSAYVWLMNEVGFLLASYGFTLIFTLVQGYRNPLVLGAITLVFPSVSWWLMTGPMRISLPSSPWFDAF